MTLWTYIVAVLTAAVIVLNAVIARRESKDASKRRLITVTALLAVLGVGGALLLHAHQAKEHAKEKRKASQRAEQRHSELTGEVNALTGENEKLRADLGQFVAAAREKYPKLAEKDALEKLAADVSRLLPRLVRIGEPETRKDDDTGLTYTVLRFRSQSSEGLWRVSIRLEFSAPVLRAQATLEGDIVTGKPECVVSNDGKSLLCSKEHLRGDNIIRVTVESATTVGIAHETLEP